MDVAPIVEYLGAQAANERARDYILKALGARLQLDVADAFKPALDSIEDAQRLDQLFDAAILIDSVADFQKVLAASGDDAANGAAGQR